MFDESFLNLVTTDGSERRRVRDALAVEYSKLILDNPTVLHFAREKAPRLCRTNAVAAYAYEMADAMMAEGAKDPVDDDQGGD